MGVFLSELGFVLAVLMGLGLAGGWVVIPFRARLPYAALATPLAGLLCVVLGVSVLYGIGALPLGFCAVVSFACSILLTVATLIRSGLRPAGWRVFGMLTAAFLTAVALTLTVDTATIRNGQPAVLYTHGTDHLGYAQVSDWVATYPISVAPKVTPQRPHAAWTEFCFRAEARFGDFYFLGIIQTLRGRSGTFSYDVACVIALCAGILAVTGVFARSWQSALLLIVGLMVSHWFDYSRCGYLGKLLGYPSALLVLGTYFALPDMRSPALLGLLVLIAGTAAVVYPGIASAMLLLAVAVPYLCAVPRQERPDRAIVAALLILVCILASGYPARPVSILSSRNGGPGWPFLAPRIFDLENQGTSLSGLSPGVLVAAIVVSMLICGLLIIAALLARDPVAVGMLAGPLLLLAGLAVVGGWVPVFQLIGIVYPFALCGVAHVMDELAEGAPIPGRIVVMVLAALMVGLRVPRYVGAVRRYAGSEMYVGWQYSKRDTDHLVRAMRRRTVLVDIDHPNQAIFVVTEIGRRNVTLQWTPRTWRTLFSYTDLKLPPYAVPAQLKLVSATEPDDADKDLPVLYQTANLKLLDLSGITR